jgi:hypothetical protein
MSLGPEHGKRRGPTRPKFATQAECFASPRGSPRIFSLALPHVADD